MDLIVGSTGLLGGAIATRLLARGREVRCLVRPASQGRAGAPHTPPEALAAAGAELVHGDLRDRASLARALRGARRVVATATATKRMEHDSIEDVDARGIAGLIDEAAAAGVERFLYVSVPGADPGAPGVFGVKGANERRLRESGMPFTILRPESFMEDWVAFAIGAQLAREAAVTLVGEGAKRHAFVALEDVARLAVAALEAPGGANRVLPLAGHAATYREVVALYERLSGRPIEVRTVPIGATVPGLPPVVSAIWAALEASPRDAVETPEVAREFGLELTRLEGFLAPARA